MLVSYDPEAKAIYIHLRGRVPVHRTTEYAPDVILDLDIDGELIGVELLDLAPGVLNDIASEFNVPDLKRVHTEKLVESVV